MDDGCEAKKMFRQAQTQSPYLIENVWEMLRFPLAHAFEVVHWLKK